MLTFEHSVFFFHGAAAAHPTTTIPRKSAIHLYPARCFNTMPCAHAASASPIGGLLPSATTTLKPLAFVNPVGVGAKLTFSPNTCCTTNNTDNLIIETQQSQELKASTMSRTDHNHKTQQNQDLKGSIMSRTDQDVSNHKTQQSQDVGNHKTQQN
ncbi:hypothetical protein BS78_06G217800 [Paspalum vaginatum]|nr:hypothetical protein BS78_06G217800 [Paspalum vaginatum]